MKLPELEQLNLEGLNAERIFDFTTIKKLKYLTLNIETFSIYENNSYLENAIIYSDDELIDTESPLWNKVNNIVAGDGDMIVAQGDDDDESGTITIDKASQKNLVDVNPSVKPKTEEKKEEKKEEEKKKKRQKKEEEEQKKEKKEKKKKKNEDNNV